MTLNIPGKFGFGTMSLTWTPSPKPIADSVKLLKFVTSHPKFGTQVINGGEFYGPNDINLKYLKAFVDSNSDEVNRNLIISIKGGMSKLDHSPKGDRQGLAESIENIISYFPSDPAKRPKLLFQISRVDPKVPYDDTVTYINEFVQAGKIDGISLSEVGVGSIRKALSAAPISCVELELSLATQDIFYNGVLAELSQYGIPVIAYSPLSRGLLTDSTVETADDFLSNLKEGDLRNRFPRFNPENFKQNILLAKKLYEFAHEVKNTSLESLALSWIVSVSGRKNFRGIPVVSKILPIPSGSTEEKIEKNLGNLVELTDEDLAHIDKITKEYPINGARYFPGHKDFA